MSRIITISREFGSGGRELGKRLAKALGIPCYDHEIIEMIAKENGFNEDYVANVAEKSIEAAYPLTIGHRFGMQPFQIMDQPIRVAVTQRRMSRRVTMPNSSRSVQLVMGTETHWYMESWAENAWMPMV